MKKEIVVRKRINSVISSLLAAMGFYSLPVQATDAKNVNQEPIDPTPLLPDSTWIDDQLATEYGCPYATFIFKGKVIDQHDNPLAAIDVLIKTCDTPHGKTQTDENGEFNIEYSQIPWCDINLSFTKDPSTIKDTTIVEGDIVFENPSGNWDRGTFARTVTVVFPTDGTMPTLTFDQATLAGIVDLNEPMFYITNWVDEYMWMNFREIKSAQISIYDMAGKLQKKLIMNDGENLFVGDLQPGRYILTATSGAKRFSSVFVKR
ncbi:MAG: radical SAM-associated putative lipoprotein [Paludibacteraceae bacterium]|nr:radical SAM-associated putative lipoprotein [Paludibacteraceae bacterium]